MIKRLLTLSLMGFLLMAASHSYSAALNRSVKPFVYVSPAGNDKWSGSLSAPNAAKTDGPVATLERARDLVRELKRTKGLPNGGLVVELQAGVYELTRTFELSAEDSGTAESPITYRASKGQQIYILAGRVLKDFKPVSDATVISRLAPEAKGKVLCTDLKAQGITQYPPMVSASTWGPSDPGLDLYFADQPMTLARWPNEGYTKITQVKGPQGVKEGIFTYEENRSNRWINEPDLMVNGYWFYDWANQRYRVKSIDPKDGAISLEYPPVHGYGFKKGQWFYAYNALSELDRPGEWYLDRQNGIMYFWPPKPLKSGRVTISLLRDALNIQDVSYLSLIGLTIECAQYSGINIRGGQQNRIAKCVIRNLGGSGINIDNSTKNEVFGCDLYNLGSGGVNVSAGDRNTLTPGGNNVENCHIYKFGQYNTVYQPAVNLSGVGNRAAHNLFNDSPHMAIGISGNDHIVEYNEVHSVVYESNDAGALYCGRDWTMRGNQIRYNYFHDIYGFESRGAAGIYLDDQFSSANIYGNICYRVNLATLIGGGRDTTIENNIFVDCNPSVHVDARGLGWAASIFDFLKERLNSVPYQSEIWSSRYPELAVILENEPMAPKNILVAHNICVGGRWDDIEGAARPGVTFKDNLLDKNPLFVDAKKQDFNMKPESPAWKLGFKPIPFDKIGLYKDPLRVSWPVKAQVRPAPKKPVTLETAKKQFSVAKLNTAPVIDGVISPGEWPETTMVLNEDLSRNVLDRPAAAHLANDGKVLYIAVTVPISDISLLKTGSKWGDNDGAEICFRPADKDAPAFVVRGFAGGGYNSDSESGVSPEAAEALGKVIKFAAKINEGNWTGEWAIPLSEAGITYKPGLKLAFNIGVRRIETLEWIMWSGALGSTWKVENGGIIVLK